MTTRAALYLRRSTDEQGASLDDQEEKGRAYCEQRGWQVVAVYRESASGYKPGTPRPALDQMMRDATSDAWQVLVVWKLNRLSRQEGARSAAAIVWQLEDLGIEVHSLKEPSTGVALFDALQRVLVSYQGAGESRGKSEDTQRGKLRSIRQHGVFHGGFPPYGYQRVGQRPSPEKPKKNIIVYGPHPERAGVVRELFRRYLDGESPRQIADDFNRRLITPPRSSGVSANRHARRGDPIWQEATIRNLLRNPLLAGYATYRGQRVKACSCTTPDDCEHDWTRGLNLPAIIDAGVWGRVQVEIAARAGRLFGGRATGGSSETFLLLGLLWCSRCGERLACRKARQTNVTDRYVCTGRRRGCDMPTIKRDLLDDAVREHFVSEHVVDTAESVRRERARLEAMRDSEAALVRDELREVERELTEVRALQRRAQLDYESGDLPAKQWARIDDECEQRLNQQEAARERLRGSLSDVRTRYDIDTISELLDALNLAKRMIAGALTAEDVPRMNAKLHEVFDSITVELSGSRLVVVPHLHDESPLTRVLDFSDGVPEETSAVEVVGELGGVVLRKIELARSDDRTTTTNRW